MPVFPVRCIVFAFRPPGGLRGERSTHFVQYLKADIQFCEVVNFTKSTLYLCCQLELCKML